MSVVKKALNLISDKEYVKAVSLIEETLSSESLSKHSYELLESNLRYCNLKLNRVDALSSPRNSREILDFSEILSIDLLALAKDSHHPQDLNISPSVSVVLPIYNAPNDLDKCLNSLARFTPSSVKIIAINDASTDEKVLNVLQSHALTENLFIYHNQTNLGFSGTVNRGFTLAGDSDVVILNSDTIVTPGWISNLKLKAYSHPKIATVTPLSNSAGPFSIAKDCSSSESVDIQKMLNSLNCKNHFKDLQILPTGHGFCMYIKSIAFKSVGYFDHQNFPKGYGEENDFCMRLWDKGLINTLDTKTYIYHAEAASFGSKKKSLMVKKGREKVDQLHPSYTKKIRAYFSSDSYRKTIEDFNSYIQNNNNKVIRRNALFVCNVKSGGTPQTNLDLMISLKRKYKVQPFCLYVKKNIAQLSAIDDNFNQVFGPEFKITETRLPSHTNHMLEKIYLQLVEIFRFSFVHVRHIGFHSIDVFRILKLFHIPCFYSLHDFYTVCPNIKLQDADNVHCKGNCSNSLASNDCNYELWDHKFSDILKNDGVYEWRELFKRCLSDASALITTSHTAYELIQNTYSDLIQRKDFRVIEHGRDLYPSLPALTESCESGSSCRLKLLAPGNITDTKGGLLIKQLADDNDLNKSIEIHVLGNVQQKLKINKNPSIICHGPYNRDDFPELIKSISPDIGLVLSVWPETYCHTLSELWMCNVPVIGTNMGAVGERLKRCGGGWVISPTYNDLKNLLQKVLKDRDEISREKGSINARSKYNYYPFVTSIDMMTREYALLYNSYCKDLFA